MEDIEKERLSIKAYRFSEVNENDWDLLLPKYKKEIGIRPIHSIISWTLLVICLSLFFLELFQPWLPIVAFTVFWLMSQRFIRLEGQIEGFQDGYEQGKTDGVCRGLGIKKSEQEKLLQEARELIIEFKVESGDPDLELGDNFRKEA